MKKSKIIILICLVVAIVATIIFATNTQKDENVLVDNNENVVIDSTNSQDEISEEIEKTNSEQIKYWIEEYEFPKETNEFNLNLYNLSLETPIKLTDLEEKCDYFEYIGSTLQDKGTHKVETISEINTTLEDGEELNVYLFMNDETRPTLSSFTIKNLSEDEQKTTQECLANGWWYIHDEYFDAESVGLTYKGDKYAADAEILLLEELIQKLGKPTKIIPIMGDPAEKDGDFGIINYYIVYEYSDFVFGILVTETLYIDSNQRGMFEIGMISYLTSEIKEDRWYYTTEGDLLK